MSRVKGDLRMAISLESEKSAPLTDTWYCDTFADVIDPAEQQALDGNTYLHYGKFAIVQHDIDTEKNGIYYLNDVSQPLLEESWTKLGAGSDSDILKILVEQTQTLGLVWSIDNDGKAQIVTDPEGNVILMQDKFILDILKDNLTPLIETLSETSYVKTQTKTLIIKGINLLDSAEFIADGFIINSITKISNTEYHVDMTASSEVGTHEFYVRTDIGKSNIFHIEILANVTGTGSAGNFVTNFNAGGTGQALWTNDWILNIGQAIDSLDGFFQSSNNTTASGGTGADANANGTIYGFIERSNPNNGANTDAYAETTNFRDLTEITFLSHKFASDGTMGDLVVYSQNLDDTWTERWRHSGNIQNNQSDSFVTNHLSTLSWDCKAVRFGFENQNSYRGDICLDNITLTSI